ncbi:MAG: His/Gly/Thr/Pro-type tRNA ligase C-terminal domain-containing protein, partial [Candidatus Omnitrophica bacterium]|nr:His/Gly/Thr/Pro-type tRNA ligase C-terminal domain-containing protein [Candidatus Omnitrophota bacterium]
NRAEVMEYCETLARYLGRLSYNGQTVRVEIDTSHTRGGEKMWNWIKKGIPVWLEIGPREVNNDQVFLGRRDAVETRRQTKPLAEFLAHLPNLLKGIQDNLYQRALKLREENTVRIDSQKEFYDFFTPANREKPEIHGGFALCHWAGNAEVLNQLKEDLGVSVRCLPLQEEPEKGRCPFTGQESNKRVIFAKAY